MDDYDPRRLKGFQEKTIVISVEDTKALIAAHPELTMEDIRKLIESGDRRLKFYLDDES